MLNDEVIEKHPITKLRLHNITLAQSAHLAAISVDKDSSQCPKSDRRHNNLTHTQHRSEASADEMIHGK